MPHSFQPPQAAHLPSGLIAIVVRRWFRAEQAVVWLTGRMWLGRVDQPHFGGRVVDHSQGLVIGEPLRPGHLCTQAQSGEQLRGTDPECFTARVLRLQVRSRVPDWPAVITPGSARDDGLSLVVEQNRFAGA